MVGGLPGSRVEQGPVVVVEGGPFDLSAQDGELVTQHDDLKVLGTSGTDYEPDEGDDEAVEHARHSWSASTAFAQFNPVAEYSKPVGPSIESWLVGGVSVLVDEAITPS